MESNSTNCLGLKVSLYIHSVCQITFTHLIVYTELNQLISKVDRKYQQPNNGSYKLKARVLSTPSQRIPPLNAPQWTVDKDYQYPPAEVEDAVGSSSTSEVVTTAEVFCNGMNTCTEQLDGSMSSSTDEYSESE